MSEQDTFSIAKNAGDKAFLRFIADRLVHVYGESPDVDYVLTLRKFADAFEPRTAAPQPPGVSPAPDALAALKTVEQHLEDGNLMRALHAARAAIAQAETGKAAARDVRDAMIDHVTRKVLEAISQAKWNADHADMSLYVRKAIDEVLPAARIPAPSPEPSRHGVEALIREIRERAVSDEGYEVTGGWLVDNADRLVSALAQGQTSGGK